jgi:hypothetical protein
MENESIDIKKAGIVLLIAVLLIILLVLIVIFRGKSINKADYLVLVNKGGVLKTDYNKKVEETVNFYKWNKQDTAQLTSLQKDVLSKLVDASLINQYAKKNKIIVSDDEIKTRYEQSVTGYNRRNKIAGKGDQDFLAKLKEMYGTNKDDYLQTLKEDILREKVQTSVNMPLGKWLEEQEKSADIQENNQ